MMHANDVCGLLADTCAIVKTSRPALGVRGVLTADDTLPAVEVYGAAESRQANIERKSKGVHHHERDHVVEDSSGDGDGALRRGATM